MKTHSLIIFAAFIIYAGTAFGQVPLFNLQWAQGLHAGNGGEGLCVAADQSNNVYLAGYYTGDTLSLGTLKVYNPNLTFAPFMARFTASGQPVWLTDFHHLFAQITNVTTYNNNKLFMAGSAYTDTVAQTTALAVAGLDSAGNIHWIDTASGSLCGVSGMATGADGSTTITGYFSGSSFGFGGHMLTGYSTSNFFAFHFSAAGAVMWAYGGASYRQSEGIATATAPDGSVYITGYFYDSLQIGAYMLYPAPGTAQHQGNFLMRCNSSGNIDYIRSLNNMQQVQAMATDAAGKPYLTGIAYDTAYPAGILSQDYFTMFALKLDTDGSQLWANTSALSQTTAACYSIVVNSQQQIYIAGTTSDTLWWGGIPLGSYQGLLAHGSDQSFLISMDASNGHITCAQTLPGGGDDNSALAADTSGNIYWGGDFQYTTFAIGSDTLYGSLVESPFLTRFLSCGEKPNTINLIPETAAMPRLYPNPGNGSFILASSGAVGGEYTVTDILGKVITQQKIISDTQTVDLHNAAPGLYLLSVNGTVPIRFTVMR